MQIADLFKAQRELFCIFQRAHIDKVVYLAHLAVALVDGADLGLKHEKRLFGVDVGHRAASQDIKLLRLAPEAIQAGGFIPFKLFCQFRPPLRVCEVARAENADTFAACPGGQMAGVKGLAGGTGKTGVNVQVSYEIHVRFSVMMR